MSDELLKNNEELFYRQIFTEFGRTKKDIDELMNVMKNWAKTQPHFPENPDDGVLRFVLLYNKLSIEKAKQKLDMYYTIRSLLPEFFRNNPFTPDMQQEFKTWYVVPLPEVTENYERIIAIQLNPKYDDPDYFDHTKFIIQFCSLLQYLCEQDLCYRFHLICDCTCAKLGHATKMSPMNIKKLSVVLEKVFSNRIASFYAINLPPFLTNFANNVILPCLNPKLRARCHLQSDFKDVLQKFGKEKIPSDFGGEGISLQEVQKLLLQNYEKHKSRFLELENLSTDESMRPEKLVNDDLLGYHGSFRSLDVD